MIFLIEDNNLSLSPTLLRAVSFAARAHHSQVRKDGRTPYIAHAMRVCLILRQLFDVSDELTLVAAILHDTIEDTTTDYDDLAEEFSPEVADYVGMLSKDKRLPDDRREEVYANILKSASAPVQLIKLADILDNYWDSQSLPSSVRQSVLERTKRYMQAMSESRHEIVQKAYRKVLRWMEEHCCNRPTPAP
jgi:guanosine-3',5'-bis(diphosphate) 3'-pyrophosphohydrolase